MFVIKFNFQHSNKEILSSKNSKDSLQLFDTKTNTQVCKTVCVSAIYPCFKQSVLTSVKSTSFFWCVLSKIKRPLTSDSSLPYMGIYTHPSRVSVLPFVIDTDMSVGNLQEDKQKIHYFLRNF